MFDFQFYVVRQCIFIKINYGTSSDNKIIMKDFTLFVISVLFVCIEGIAGERDINCVVDAIADKKTEISEDLMQEEISLDHKRIFLQNKTRASEGDSEGVIFKEITVPAAGMLADVLGADVNTVDSLVVKGEINEADFNTLWSGTFYGRLSSINLEQAVVENGIIPSNAFWHKEEQWPGDETIYVNGLRKLILPEGVKAIGDLAFSYCIHLESINFPTTLGSLGMYCFSDCISLGTSPLLLPEGMSDVPPMCFLNCESLDSVILPTTISHIGEGAFYRAKLSRINLPEGLRSIGNCAFYASNLLEVSLPASCQDFIGTHHFALNHELKKINIPHGVMRVPNCFVFNCVKLKEIEIPESLEIIGNDAFSSCYELLGLNLPEGLTRVESNGLWYCKSLKKLVLPSSLTYLGGASCMYMQSLEAIYCMAPVPPVCDEDPANPGRDHTFGNIMGEPSHICTPNNIPVYVPVGTANLYASAYGWNYFNNFIEVDFSGIDEVHVADRTNDFVYNLNGVRVYKLIPGNMYVKNGVKFVYAE